MGNMEQSTSEVTQPRAEHFQRDKELEKLVQDASKGSWSNRSVNRVYPGQDVYVPTYVSAGSR